MVTGGLYKFFSDCPQFLKKRININFLGHNEGDVSIEPIGDFSIIKKYSDGKRVMSQEFCLSIRCAFDANIRLNLKDAQLMEAVCQWIDEQDRAGALPNLSDTLAALGISVTKTPHIYESSVQGAKMQIYFKLTYREI